MDNILEFLIYKTEDEEVSVNALMQNDTIWLTQKAMAELFGVQVPAISKHLKNIFEEGELDSDVVISKMETTAQHGAIDGKVQINETNFYNLDAIISVGYRVNSRRATQFRIWATKVLKEYMIKGFALDDNRLKNLGGGNYWKELLERIRDIRSSEKIMYRQVLDLYATSIDYDSNSIESRQFFQMVQNKLHYAAHGHTAAEIIYERANAEKPFMGLTTFSGDFPLKKDVTIAKNYLKEDELKVLNNLVSGYFDIAEINAIEHKPMYMKDYIEQLDRVLSSGGRPLLEGRGKVKKEVADEKAKEEYKKFQLSTLTPVEEAYLDIIDGLNKTAKNKKGKKSTTKYTKRGNYDE